MSVKTDVTPVARQRQVTADEPEAAPTGSRPSRATHDQRSQLTAQLFSQAVEATDEHDVEQLLERVIALNIPVAEAVASRYHQRGLDDDDIDAVARLGLVKAARRFDPSLGHDFLSFAVPTIRGEVRRHFRDFGWVVRPPRRVQELQQRLASVSSELSMTVGHQPTSAEVARELGCTPKDVEETRAASGCFTPTSLSTSPSDLNTVPLSERLGGEDPGMHRVETIALLQPAIGTLKDRDRTILRLRFYDGLNQYEIAQRLGITQVQVSRLLHRIMRDLRLALGDDAAP